MVDLEPFNLKASLEGLEILGERMAEHKSSMNVLQVGDAVFRSMFVNHSAVMYIVDLSDFSIIDANQAALDFYGYDRKTMLTKRIPDLNTTPEDEIRTEIQKAIKEGRAFYIFKHRLANGAIRDVEIYANPVTVGDLELSFSIVHDITKRKKAETALKESNEELDAFVQTVAHDLRTPVTPIIGYAEILREKYKEQLDEQGLSYLAEIEKAGEEMLALMENLLSLAKAGDLNRPDKCVSTDEVAAGVIKNLEADIFSAGVLLQTTSLPSVRVPKTFLIQIFDNLIGNAVRYAANSGGLIEVGGEQTGKQIRFYVRDHGPGIPEQERKHIFEVFYRGTNKGEVKGSGVGLSIVYKIARNCGGRAWVEETHGGGCTFWVEIEDVAHF